MQRTFRIDVVAEGNFHEVIDVNFFGESFDELSAWILTKLWKLKTQNQTFASHKIHFHEMSLKLTIIRIEAGRAVLIAFG